MSYAFRDLLKKIGSGPHTGKDLTREESAAATRMMLLQEATPAQIGAFMIAHRIKRPTGEELAGMLDAYEELGPKLQPIASRYPVTTLCSPYDGRDRTMPLSPLTALVLAAAECPVVLHGGDRMPTKEGVPLMEIWQGLGVNWSPLSLEQVQTVLEQTTIGFVYLPSHSPLAQGLVPYREQIGKRPPFATLELMWSPYTGKNAHIVTGFVHPPTEGMAQAAFALRGVTRYTTVKGLEGSCDLPRERTAIIGSVSLPEPSSEIPPLDRFLLHARDYGFEPANVPIELIEQTIAAMTSVLEGESSELKRSLIWNSGFYLWRSGVCDAFESGLAKAEELISQGKALEKLKELQSAVQAAIDASPSSQPLYSCTVSVATLTGNLDEEAIAFGGTVEEVQLQIQHLLTSTYECSREQLIDLMQHAKIEPIIPWCTPERSAVV